MKKVCRYLFTILLSLTLFMNSFVVTGYAEGDDIIAEHAEQESVVDVVKEVTSDPNHTESDTGKEDSLANAGSDEGQNSDGSPSSDKKTASEVEPDPIEETKPEGAPTPDEEHKSEGETMPGAESKADGEVMPGAESKADGEAMPGVDPKADGEAIPGEKSKSDKDSETGEGLESGIDSEADEKALSDATEEADLKANSKSKSENKEKGEEGKDKDKGKDKENEKEFPAFCESTSVGDITITVEAEEGVFPAGAKLFAESISSSETSGAISEKRSGDQNVARTYSFDIKVLDEDGNELQPEDGRSVKVSFSMTEVADPNLDVSIYHVSDEDHDAKELSVEISGETAAAESDGFSYYTVEFTYGSLSYTLGGGERTSLSEILSAVGLVGNAKDVYVSNSELFSASKEDDEWVIYSHQAFSSDEWMKVTIEDITYEIEVTDDAEYSGTCGNGLTWTISGNTLTISKTGDGDGAMDNWIDFGYIPWYGQGSDIETVNIGSGVTTIGDYAFSGCSGLKSITLPDSLTSIGDGAFLLCDGLTSITLPDSITSMGIAVFQYCRSLTSITIPDSLTTIGDGAFLGCGSLTSITLPASLTTIGDRAFYYCSGLTSITLPDSLTTIGDWAFYYCSGLTSITFPDSLATIGDYAFVGCDSLTSITFPDSLTTIGYEAFSGCNDLTTVYYNGLNWGTLSASFPSNVTLAGFVSVTVDVNPTNGGTISGSGYIEQVGAAKFRFKSGTDACLTALPATNYHFVKWTDANGTLLSNSATYSFPAAETTLKANFAGSISINGNISSHTYDGNVYNPIPTITDEVIGSELRVNTDYTISYQKYDGTGWSDISSQNVKNAGEYRVVATGISGSAYEGETATKDFSISRKNVTITAADHSFTYTGATQSWPYYDVTELVGNDEITATITGSITYPAESPVSNKVEAYSFTIGSADNYSVTTVNGSLTMENADIPITITAASTSKIYDGTALTDSTVTLTSGSLLTGDSLVATANGSATNVSDTIVGNNPVAPGYKIMHDAMDVTNCYDVTTVAGTLTINPKDLAITAQNKTFTYTGAIQSWPYYDVSGLMGNDVIDVTITGSITLPDESPVPNVVQSYRFTSGSEDNYSVTTNNGQLTMAKASRSITITAASASKTYDGTPLTDSNVTLTSGSLLTGDRLVARANGSATNVSDTSAGNNLVAAGYKILHGAVDVTDNYVITPEAGTLTINPKVVTVTAQDKQFTYDGTSHIHPGFDVSGLVGSDAIDATVTGSITFPSEGSVTNAVSAYRFTTGTAGNYSVTTKNGRLTMARASNPITITAASASKIYDGTPLTDSNVTLTSGSLLTGDRLVARANGSATNVSDTKAGNNHVAPGYKIIHGTVDVTENYVITTVAGTLTINPKAVNITAQDNQFTYDGTSHSHTGFEVSGLVGSDAIDATVTGSITFPSEGQVVNAVSSYSFTSGIAGNYSVTTKNGKLTMAKASNPITITAASASKTYDGAALTDSTVTLTEGSLFTGDSLIASANGSATNVFDTKIGNNPVAAGYKIMHGTVDVTENYVVTTVAGTLTINSKPVTITDNDNKSSDNGSSDNSVSEDEVNDPPINNKIYDVLKEKTQIITPLAADDTDAAVLGEVRKTSRKAAVDETPESDNDNKNDAEVANQKIEETKEPEKTSETPKTEIEIEETETAKAASPIAASSMAEEKPIAWGWLIFGIAAIAGVFIEEYVRRHKNK